MLGRLLKYDFNSVFKYWWIAALISFVLCTFVGGGCMFILENNLSFPDVFSTLAMLALVLTVLGLSAFIILTMILIFIRFYRNFFSDEGYLTFTLPVKRSALLNSKLIMGTVTQLLTGLLCAVNVVSMITVGFAEDIFTPTFFSRLSEVFDGIFREIGIYFIIYIVEILVLTVLLVVMSVLFMFCCITFASIITRRAKVITAIGIYYGANSVFSFIMQMFCIFGLAGISEWLLNIPESSEEPVTALVFLGLILFVAVLCAILYTLEYFMLDRKLNLS